MKDAFVIMTNTFCQGDIIGCHDGDGKPEIFDTEADAWKEIAENKILELQQFIDGERELEHTDFSFDEWVQPVTVHDDGTIVSEEGQLWPIEDEFKHTRKMFEDQPDQDY